MQAVPTYLAVVVDGLEEKYKTRTLDDSEKEVVVFEHEIKGEAQLRNMSESELREYAKKYIDRVVVDKMNQLEIIEAVKEIKEKDEEMIEKHHNWAIKNNEKICYTSENN